MEGYYAYSSKNKSQEGFYDDKENFGYLRNLIWFYC